MKKFSELYQEVYQEAAEELNAKKKEKRVKHLLLLSAVILSFLLWSIMPLAFTASIIVFGIWLFLSYHQQRVAYVTYYKEKIIQKFIKSYSEKLNYFPHQGVDRSLYDLAQFERNYDRYYTEDLITGTILNHNKIVMGEIHTQREERTVDSDGRTKTTHVTLFHGIFTAVELPQKVHFILRISRNDLLSNVLNTSDKIQSMRILTADVMEKLIDFKNNHKIIPEIIIKGNSLYIRYATGPVFEPNTIRNDMNFEKLKKYYDIIQFTIGLAEEITKNMEAFEE